MNFNLSKSIEILERTPSTLVSLVLNISSDWTANNEGGETWSVFDIVGHLVQGEKTDWIPRMEIILSDKPDKRFQPFDRYAQFKESGTQTLTQRLEEFRQLRESNMAHLQSKNLTDEDLAKKGIHPDFGEITLAQLLSTWTVHDLNHIAQISRVMARQYQTAVGPWLAYLKILQ